MENKEENEMINEQQSRVDPALKDVPLSSYDAHILVEAMRDMHAVMSELLFALSDEFVQYRAEQLYAEMSQRAEDDADADVKISDALSQDKGGVIRKGKK